MSISPHPAAILGPVTDMRVNDAFVKRFTSRGKLAITAETGHVRLAFSVEGLEPVIVEAETLSVAFWHLCAVIEGVIV